ncbi:MAG: hypothetical protein VKL59_22335 [Nostocaceae cyanobacterium]|nr:hypothetical protein [Nostocaceae cyanobacterium]
MARKRYRTRAKRAITLLFFLIVARKRRRTVNFNDVLSEHDPLINKIEIAQEDLLAKKQSRQICKSMTEVVRPELQHFSRI